MTLLLTPLTGCFEGGKYYQEGEKLPSDDKRPCDMCYCIKGLRKCVTKKCAPLIRGCIPRLPQKGTCCPTSYDCSRSLKVTRQIQQQSTDNDEEDEPEEDTDSIDFFSLLFGSDEPPEQQQNTEKADDIETTTTLQPFKALPTTEKSFFDFIRAGLEIIDANHEKIDSSLNDIVTTPKSLPKHEVPTPTVVTNNESSTEKLKTTTTQQTTSTTLVIQSSHKPEADMSTTTMQLPTTPPPTETMKTTEKLATMRSTTPKMFMTVGGGTKQAGRVGG